MKLKMDLALILLVLYGQNYVRACKPKLEGPVDSKEAVMLNKTYWQPHSKDQAAWDKWLKDYKKNIKENSGETDARIVIDDGRPLEFQGYGHGSDGVPPPPWAFFPGDHGKPDLCFQDSDVGICKKNETRWGYNPYTEKCTQFQYSGCGGNDNNFLTKPRCELACAIDVATNCQIFDDSSDQYNN